MLIAVMLAKGIITKQHCIFGHIGHHAIWPVQHWRFNKDKLFTIANIDAVAGFNYFEVPFRVMVMADNRVYSSFSTVNWRAWDFLHQGR